MIILLGLLAWSLVKVFVTVILRVCVIYRARAAGVWLLGALWSLQFQLLITPARRASNAASEVPDCVAVKMECQAHHEDNRRPVGYPTSLLADMERGSSLYPLTSHALGLRPPLRPFKRPRSKKKKLKVVFIL